MGRPPSERGLESALTHPGMTPGPWQHDPLDSFVFYESECGNFYIPVAEIEEPYCRGPEESCKDVDPGTSGANGRAVAALPYLIWACRRMAAALQQLRDQEPGICAEHRDALEGGKAALKRAGQ
jgi:hypothetical protein